MVSLFKGILELLGILFFIIACQPFLCRYVHVAAAATTRLPGHLFRYAVSASLDTTPSSAVSTTNLVSDTTNTFSSAMSTSSILAATSGQLPSSYPQNSTITSASGLNFDTSWQEFYLVTQGLPDITFPLGNNYAGNIPVGRPGHPNNTLFFWGFENNVGSLTAPVDDIQSSPWLIWLGGGGGPGSSSVFASMIANGPMLLHSDFSISQNPKSLTNLIDTFWVDQPVGAGFSTADSTGYVNDEDDVAADFIGFLINLVKVFPSLATRPLYLAGEDYAGVYISYISKALLTSSTPPVVLQKIVIGNGLLQDISVSTNLAIMSIIGSVPQLIRFDQNIYKAFQSKAHVCGYDVNLTYPQEIPLSAIRSSGRRLSTLVASQTQTTGLLQRRDVLNPYYGCSLFDELVDYAANFSFPWSPGTFDPFDVTDVIAPQPSIDGGVYFNSLQVRAALHAPFSKNWTSVDEYSFGSTSSATNLFGDPSPPPATFFDDLVSIAGSNNVQIILYSSGNNVIAHHRSLEILIQNTTFGGTRGFTRKPSTPWTDDDGNVAGIVHQERGILYALFDNVGSFTPSTNPTAAYTFFREFVLNSNATGSITIDSNNKLAVLGGEDSHAADDAPRVVSEIFLGAKMTQSTLIAPSATVATWQSFLADTLGNPTDSAESLARQSGRLWISVLCTALCFVLNSMM